jgi:hypothetical protein
MRFNIIVIAIFVVLYLAAVLWRQQQVGEYFDRLEAEIAMVHHGKLRLYEAEPRWALEPAPAATAAAVADQAATPRSLAAVVNDIQIENVSFMYQIEQVRQHRAYARRHWWNPLYNFQKHDIMSVGKPKQSQ